MRRTATRMIVCTLALLHASISFAAERTASRNQEILATAAQQGKFTFIMFYKRKDAQGDLMKATLDEMVAARGEKATWVAVQATDPVEKPLVDRFEVSRAPMPLVLAVAPNGAVTGAFTDKISPEELHDAIVSPCLADCMMHMQAGKLVLLWVHAPGYEEPPQAVHDFQADPKYAKKTIVLRLPAGDPGEVGFLEDLAIDPAATTGVAAFMGPPGVLLGKFDATAGKPQLVAALKAANEACPVGCKCQKCQKQ